MQIWIRFLFPPSPIYTSLHPNFDISFGLIPPSFHHSRNRITVQAMRRITGNADSIRLENGCTEIRIASGQQIDQSCTKVQIAQGLKVEVPKRSWYRLEYIWMYWSIKLEYLSAIEIQKAQVYKIDIPRYRQHKARKLVKEPKYR